MKDILKLIGYFVLVFGVAMATITARNTYNAMQYYKAWKEHYNL